MEAFFLVALLLLIVTSLILVLIWTVRNGISPMPTSPKVKKRLLDELPVAGGKNIFDLGSGWGNLAIALAKEYPSCTITGVENSPLPYLYSQIRKRLRSLSNLEFKNKDFFEVSLREADWIICYLCPAIMQKLKGKLTDELKPGSLVVSHTFAVPGWKPTKTLFVNDFYKTPIYFYRIDTVS